MAAHPASTTTTRSRVLDRLREHLALLDEALLDRPRRAEARRSRRRRAPPSGRPMSCATARTVSRACVGAVPRVLAADEDRDARAVIHRGQNRERPRRLPEDARAISAKRSRTRFAPLRSLARLDERAPRFEERPGDVVLVVAVLAAAEAAGARPRGRGERRRERDALVRDEVRHAHLAPRRQRLARLGVRDGARAPAQLRAEHAPLERRLPGASCGSRRSGRSSGRGHAVAIIRRPASSARALAQPRRPRARSVFAAFASG